MAEANLTAKQAHFRRVWQRFVRKYGHAPTLQQIADQMSLSTSMVKKYQDQLIERGAATRVAGKTAGFRLT